MRALICLGLGPTAAAGHAQTATETWHTGGFAMPESALYGAEPDGMLVSNIGGFGPDGGRDGRLSLMMPDGTLDHADWVTGLMDPKGMATAGGKLYVAVAMGLQVVDLVTATLESTVALDGTRFPGDVAAGPDGTNYLAAFFWRGRLAVRDGVADFALAAARRRPRQGDDPRAGAADRRGLGRDDGEALVACRQDPEAAEGIGAFFDRRKPAWVRDEGSGPET